MIRRADVIRRLLVGAVLGAALTPAATSGAAKDSAAPVPVLPSGFLPPPEPADNPSSAAKVALGRELFFDKRLSSDGTISCASCHKPSRAFADDRARSIGIEGRRGPRHTPSLINAAYFSRLMWDGKALSLEDQVRYPVTSPSEMNMTHAAVVDVVKSDPGYMAAFTEAFGDDRVTFDGVAQAIAAFERTLVHASAPFDRYLSGEETALSPSAQRGWALFRGKAGCTECHAYDPLAPLFTDFGFHNTGLGFQAEEPDLGRYRATRKRRDKGRFRTPSLRNVTLTAPYMHDGRFATLPDVIDYYDAGGHQHRFLDPVMRPLGLTDGEKRDLVNFLESLTGDEVTAWSERAAMDADSDSPLEPTYQFVAGGGPIGDGGPATAARIAGIGGLAVASDGRLFFSDIGNNRVRSIDPGSGQIDTVLGTGSIAPRADSGGAGHAVFSPGPLALSHDETTLYAAEVPTGRVLAVDLGSGHFRDLGQPDPAFRQLVGMVMGQRGPIVVDPVTDRVWEHDGTAWHAVATSADGLQGGPRGLAVDGSGNLFIGEFFTHRVVQLHRGSRLLSTALGIGRPGRARDGSLASISPAFMPDGLAFGPDGGLYVAELGNDRILRIDPQTKRVATVAWSKELSGPRAWKPGKIVVDGQGGLWIGDIRHNRIIHFVAGSDDFTVKAGSHDIGDGAPAGEAVLAHPGRITLDEEGNLYIADTLHHRVRRVDARTGRILTIAGTGVPGYSGDGKTGAETQLNYPAGLLIKDQRLLIGDYYNNLVRSLDLVSHRVSSVAGSVAPGEDGDGGPAQLATMLNPQALASLDDGRVIVTSGVTPSIRAIDLHRGIIDRLELDPEVVPPHRTQIFYGVARVPGGFMAVDGIRGRVIKVSGGQTSVVVPPGKLNHPMDIAISPAGSVYICDSYNDRIVRLEDGGLESVVSGLGRPRGIAMTGEGDLYIADTFHNRIVRVPRVDRVKHEVIVR